MTKPIPIPAAALAQHIAVVGKTGSGKTSTAKLAIEQVVADGARVCVLDLIKSDWWGLISSADGKRAGLPFHVLGGPHGHVPLHSGAGAAIGELVARGDLPLSIVDMAEFEPGGQHKFFIAFADALLKRMRGVLYLVLEEAHEFAPKERAGFDKENLALHYAKKFATAGRSKGIRLIVATQRTQALHNALLGSCETMIVHRLTAPADQEPVLKWLKANVNDKARQEEIAGGISSLKTGEGWLCSGEAKIFERIQFPRIHTFDNSATPTHDGAEVKVTAANIDFDKLHALIGTAISEAEANDPKLLKARIRELEAAAAKRSPAADPADNAELRVLRRKVEDFERRVDELTLYGEHMFAAAAQTQAISDELEEKTRAIRAVRWPRQPKAVQPSAPGTPPGDNPAPARVIPTPAPRPSTNGSGEHGLGKPQFNVLRALYWLRSEERTVAKVAFYADYSPTSSSYEKALSGLRSAGLVQGWSITSDGERLISAHAGEKPGREQLVFWLRDKLDGPQLAIFDALLAARGRRMKAEELAPASDYSVTSSSFEKALSKLRSIGAADGYEKDGGARAAAVFFE